MTVVAHLRQLDTQKTKGQSRGLAFKMSWWCSSPLEETSLPHGHCHRRRNCNPWAFPRGMRRPPLISPHPWVLKRTASTALARGRWPVFVRVDSQRAASPPRISFERHQKSANLKILHYATHICSRLATTMTSSADEGEILTLKQVADFLKVRNGRSIGWRQPGRFLRSRSVERGGSPGRRSINGFNGSK